MKKAVLVYWLIPARPERELFRELIRILAKQFRAPPFQPHLTLCLGEDRQSPRTILRRLKASPLRLQIRGTGHSARFTKTLFVRVKPAATLSRLAAALGSRGPQDPHVSLIYKRLPARIRKELAATVQLPLRTISFDQIRAVRCVSPTTSARDVQSWRVVATKRLG